MCKVLVWIRNQIIYLKLLNKHTHINISLLKIHGQSHIHLTTELSVKKKKSYPNEINISLQTCPWKFMMTTVLDRLHTTNCSAFFGIGCTLCTVMSVPTVPPRDLKVLVHSAVFIDQTLMVPSELALSVRTNRNEFAKTESYISNQCKMFLYFYSVSVHYKRTCAH